MRVEGKTLIHNRKVKYTAKVSTFGNEFGIAVWADIDTHVESLNMDAEALDRFLVAKHRELELAFMESRKA